MAFLIEAVGNVPGLWWVRPEEEMVLMADKSDVAEWLKQTAQNDADHGRDSKDNPNNKPNGSR